jgi:heme-degrading monooxygenase HmoA
MPKDAGDGRRRRARPQFHDRMETEVLGFRFVRGFRQRRTSPREKTMFSVIFEVQPRPERWDDYLGNAQRLRPELERVDGFIDNIRYKSLLRDGWILSLSDWRDEKSVVRWRTDMHHHEVQEKGRGGILADYHLRVGQITEDTQVPEGCQILEQRLDETDVGEAKAITLITAKRPATFQETTNPEDCAEFLGLNPYADGLVSYEVFEAVLTPGDLILLCAWRDAAAADAFATSVPGPTPAGGRLRTVRIVRDYGMFDRREAPQYYPDVAKAAS